LETVVRDTLSSAANEARVARRLGEELLDMFREASASGCDNRPAVGYIAMETVFICVQLGPEFLIFVVCRLVERGRRVSASAYA
jgi:hypothetical protein